MKNSTYQYYNVIQISIKQSQKFNTNHFNFKGYKTNINIIISKTDLALTFYGKLLPNISDKEKNYIYSIEKFIINY